MKTIEQLTFEKACKVEKLDAKKIILAYTNLAKLFPGRDRKSIIAEPKVRIMIKAANRLANNGKEWIPDFDNYDQLKYEPYFILGSSGFRFGDYVGWNADSGVGSRLCFINYNTMKLMVENKHYMKVYNEYAL